MDVYIRFLFDFMTQLFGGLKSILMGLVNGIISIFNFKAYYEVVKEYSKEFSGGQWVLVAIAVLIVFALILGILYLGLMLIRKYMRIRKSLVAQEMLLEEVASLNRDVLKLTSEKEKILAMKVSQLGLKPAIEGTDPTIKEASEGQPGDTVEGQDGEAMPDESLSRFFKLTQIDEEMENYVPDTTNNEITLEEIIEMFRNFAASNMRLYYKPKVIRLFISSFAATRLIILQGISGTGKTSLPYAFGKFINNDAVIASVQPSWRDRTELFGYFNEFTKKFNETEVLRKMYEATYVDKVYVTILDEMNIARVEYYFAEMLSILEMPSRDEWVIDLVPSVWPTDPKHLPGGKLHLPDNMWYIGTINNDDSTFMVTDKVYDRAIPININDKGEPFEAPVTGHLSISSKYFESLFEKAKEDFQVSEENLKKLEQMDNYVIEHFRIAFGNRILKQLHDFVPAYIACGGTEVDGIDYIVANKILRKFEQLNLSFIRDEIDGFIDYLSQLYGKENFGECKDFLMRLKRLI